MIRLEVRNMAASLLVGYLVDELSGTAGSGGSVSGDGWVVRFIPGEPAGVGRFRVPVLFIEIEGPKTDIAHRFLRQKTMRGGG